MKKNVTYSSNSYKVCGMATWWCFLHWGFINFFKGNRFCEFTGNFENDVQAKATVIGCMKEDETIMNIEMPNEPMKKLLLRNGVTFNEEI